MLYFLVMFLWHNPLELKERGLRASSGGFEAAVREGPVEIAPHILAITSAINRIYDNSVDIVDLVKPQTSIRIVFNWALLRKNGEKLDY